MIEIWIAVGAVGIALVVGFKAGAWVEREDQRYWDFVFEKIIERRP